MHKSRYRGLWFLFTVGWYIALSLVVPTAIGYWLDQNVTHTAPVLTLVGFGIGTLLAFGGLYRMVMRFSSEARAEDNKESSVKGDEGAGK